MRVYLANEYYFNGDIFMTKCVGVCRPKKYGEKMYRFEYNNGMYKVEGVAMDEVQFLKRFSIVYKEGE